MTPLPSPDQPLSLYSQFPSYSFVLAADFDPALYPPETKFVAAYARISDDEEDTRRGVHRQIPDCLDNCARRFPGYVIVLFVDNDKSAFAGGRKKRRPRSFTGPSWPIRPEYDDAFYAIETGIIHALVGYDLDRVWREGLDLELFLNLADTVHCYDVATSQGDVDLSNSNGRMMARFMVSVAKKSSEDTSRRKVREIADSKRQGKHLGVTPYGFTKVSGVLTPNRDTIAIYTDALTDIVNGKDLRTTLREMPSFTDQHGNPCRFADARGFKTALLSGNLTGESSPGVPAAWPVFIDPALQARAAAILNDPRRNIRGPMPSTVLKRWLLGIMWCPRCDRPLKSQVSAYKAARRYLCPVCWVGIDALRTEARVEAAIFARLDVTIPEPTFDLSREPERLQLESEIAQLAADYGAGEMSRDEWRLARAGLVSRLPPTPRLIDVPLTLADEWATMSPLRRQAIAGQFLDRIDLSPPTNKAYKIYDSTRLTLHWQESVQ
jgi:DNA invertase Pin-like site-specific DNA recombinase